MKKLEILKSGNHVGRDGITVRISDSDLRTMARVYDPSLYRAPLVIGHPEIDSPAYGWVRSLEFNDGVLLAEPAQVAYEFAERVNNGRYLSVSASLYGPSAAGNPRPGFYYLRHVGFLGAHPPAVKGLASPSFCDASSGIVEVGIHPRPIDLTRYI